MESIIVMWRQVRKTPAWYPQSFPKWGYLPVADWRSSEYCSPSHCKEQPVLEQHKKGQSNRSYEEADVETYCNGLLCGMWRWLVEYRVGGREAISDVFCCGHCKYPNSRGIFLNTGNQSTSIPAMLDLWAECWKGKRNRSTSPSVVLCVIWISLGIIHTLPKSVSALERASILPEKKNKNYRAWDYIKHRTVKTASILAVPLIHTHSNTSSLINPIIRPK